jgi:hypothetical protein
MDLRRLRTGEIVAAGSALALFVLMFVSWYGLDLGGTGLEEAVRRSGIDTTQSAWQAFSVLDIFLLLVIILAVGLAALQASQRSAALPVAASVITTVLGIVAAVIVFIRLLDQPGPNEFTTVEWGAYLGFLATVGIAVGGYLSMREEGTTFDDARVALGGRSSTRPAPPPGEAEERPASPPPGGIEERPARSTPPPPERPGRLWGAPPPPIDQQPPEDTDPPAGESRPRGS